MEKTLSEKGTKTGKGMQKGTNGTEKGAERSQEGSKGCQKGRKGSQNGAKGRQREPKGSQGVPKGNQGGTKRHPKISLGARVDFGSEMGGTGFCFLEPFLVQGGM